MARRHVPILAGPGLVLYGNFRGVTSGVAGVLPNARVARAEADERVLAARRAVLRPSELIFLDPPLFSGPPLEIETVQRRLSLSDLEEQLALAGVCDGGRVAHAPSWTAS